MTLEQAKDQIAELEERIRQLIDERGDNERFSAGLALPKRLSMLAGMFTKRRLVTHEQIINCFYGGCFDSEPRKPEDVIAVTVAHLRRKLSDYEIKIRSRYTIGYEISEADQTKLRALVTTMRRDGE